MQKSIKQDNICPVCMQLMCKPHQLDGCTHVFCLLCIHNIAERTGKKCPMCRAKFDHQKIIPKTQLQKQIQAEHPEVYKGRLQQLTRWMNSKPIRFVYGNTSSPRSESRWDWTFYFRLGKEYTMKTSDLVQKIQVELHPTFTPRIVRLQPPLFQFTRNGWGTFNISFTVFWKGAAGTGSSRIEHYLEFVDKAQRQYKRRVEELQ